MSPRKNPVNESHTERFIGEPNMLPLQWHPKETLLEFLSFMTEHAKYMTFQSLSRARDVQVHYGYSIQTRGHPFGVDSVISLT